MNTTATNRKIRILLSAIRNHTLIPRPEFQRKLVWRNKDKISFLDTVLNGYPFPEIYIAAGDVNPSTGEGTEMLVDGQQRITTLYEYFTGSDNLILGKQTPSYIQLSREEQINFLEYEVVVRDLGQMNLDIIKEVFKRINLTKYPLNAMEIRNAVYNGEFIKFANEISEDRFFEINKIFNSNDIRRMQDVAFALLIIITIMSTYFPSDDDFEEFLKTYNETFDAKEEIRKELGQVFSFIEACNFEPNNRIWQKTNLFNLIVELQRSLIKENLTLEPALVSAALKAFYHKLANINEADLQPEESKELNDYYRAYRFSSDDRSSRIKRGEIIQRILTSTLSSTPDSTD